ncbi:MAG: hypothetical protein A3G75_07760 [Verrucomicrobia bacterium RIFCSPLOWO2_12_FULL_64_8]|nr:MAG: hypothetical protein A3G75_07760 [Verrucomicrobia bacterium RIFCSPLOWO2_12_FULL_64_8]
MEMVPSVPRKLLANARRAARHAYAPYSRFRGGAAVPASSVKIASGANVEYACYDLTNCAECTAVFKADDDGARRIAAVAVRKPARNPAVRCGTWREVIDEFGPRAVILCVYNSQKRIETALDCLLPDAFGPRNLR